MSRFRTELVMTPVHGQKRMWLIDMPLVYESDLARTTIVVPRGFICDLNSIPRPLWWISPPTDFPEAGVVHDFLYRYKVLPRHVCDEIYREALGTIGAGRKRQFIRYWGVRLGGRWAYKKPAKEPR